MEEAVLAAELLQRSGIELVPTRALMADALRLAIALDHPAYDCMYLALAAKRDAHFVTADRTFVRRLHQGSNTDLARRVMPLGEIGAING